MDKLRKAVVELYKKVATSIPPDIENGLKEAITKSISGSDAEHVLSKMLKTITSSRSTSESVCEDIGVPIFYVKVPKGLSHIEVQKVLVAATRDATGKIPLKANAVNVVTGENTNDNTGVGFPVIHIEETLESSLSIELLLTGAKSLNAGHAYQLPDETLGAGRDLEGIKTCVIDAVRTTGSRSCPPYIVGVGVAATRDRAAMLSQAQLLRKLPDTNPDPALGNLEAALLDSTNQLEIGPLGHKGAPTVIGVKIGVNHRHAETFAVDVSIACWATRRGKLIW